MAGQLIPRGDRTWLVRVFLGRDSNGKRRYHNKTIHGTKKDAQAYLNKTMREKDLGVHIEGSKQAIDEYLDQWLNTVVKQRVSARTFDDYEAILRRYIRPAFGNVPLSDLKAIEIQRLYNEMQEKGLSARTVRYAHAVLRSAMNQAVKWQMIQSNPVDLVDLPRKETKEMAALSPKEVERFLSIAKDDAYYVLFLVAITTGMRPGEYLALQWKDIDFDNQTISVQRAIAKSHGEWQFKSPKTARGRRKVKVTSSVLQALRTHRKAQAAQRLARGSYEDFDLVFSNGSGKPLDRGNLDRRHFKKILEEAKLPQIRLYDLRHTCATLLLSAGENPKVVSEMLGHASISLTLDTYSHVLPDMQEGAAEKLEALIFG